MTAPEGVAWSASVVQPFEWPGRIGLRKAIANRDIELANLGYERFKLALAGRVRTLGFALFAAQEKAAAAQNIAERFRELREVLVQRDASGLSPLLETRVIEATEMTMQRKSTEASLDKEKALLERNQLRGVDPNTPLLVSQPPLSFRSGENLQAQTGFKCHTTLSARPQGLLPGVEQAFNLAIPLSMLFAITGNVLFTVIHVNVDGP